MRIREEGLTNSLIIHLALGADGGSTTSQLRVCVPEFSLRECKSNASPLNDEPWGSLTAFRKVAALQHTPKDIFFRPGVPPTAPPFLWHSHHFFHSPTELSEPFCFLIAAQLSASSLCVHHGEKGSDASWNAPVSQQDRGSQQYHTGY